MNKAIVANKFYKYNPSNYALRIYRNMWTEHLAFILICIAVVFIDVFAIIGAVIMGIVIIRKVFQHRKYLEYFITQLEITNQFVTIDYYYQSEKKATRLATKNVQIEISPAGGLNALYKMKIKCMGDEIIQYTFGGWKQKDFIQISKLVREIHSD